MQATTNLAGSEKTVTVEIASATPLAAPTEAATETVAPVVPAPMSSVEESSREEAATMVRGVNLFALDLYGQLRSRTGNLFFSPYSISTALAMTGAGARGDTAGQMARVLHLAVSGEGAEALIDPPVHARLGALQTQLQESAAQSETELIVANRLWGQEGYSVLPAFTEALERFYRSGIESLDFVKTAEAARARINGWVSKETKGLIRDLFAPGSLDASTRLVVTNAVYFKGTWLTPFKKTMTQAQPFHVSPERQVEVQMMYRAGMLGYCATEAVQVLEMPYRQGALSMVIVLPRERDGLPAVERDLDETRLDEWMSALSPTEVQVFVPRFKLSEGFGLSGALKTMGMQDAFVPDRADFSAITGTRDLFVSDVVHKAYVDVNEEGTEAAAATGVAMGVASAPPAPTVFRADHPFLFLIRDTATGTILFLGRLQEPETA